MEHAYHPTPRPQETLQKEEQDICKELEKEESAMTSGLLDVTRVLHRRPTEAMVVYTTHPQYRAHQHSIMDGRRAHEASSLAEELLGANACWRRGLVFFGDINSGCCACSWKPS